MAETSTIFGFMKYVSATDILSDFKKTVDSHFVNSLKPGRKFQVFLNHNNLRRFVVVTVTHYTEAQICIKLETR